MRQRLGGKSSGINLIIFGALIVLVVCYQPRGIMGIYEDFKSKFRERGIPGLSKGAELQ